MAYLQLISDGVKPVTVRVTSPTTLVTPSGKIMGIAAPSGQIIEPAESTTGKIEELWDEFNRPVTVEVVWDGAQPSKFGNSMGLLNELR